MLENPNYRQILRLIFSGKPFTQVELSQKIQLSTAAVCKIVRDLRNHGLVCAAEKADRKGQSGRKATILGLDDEHFCIISVWVEGNISAAALTLSRETIAATTSDYEDCKDLDSLIGRINDAVNSLRDTIEKQHPQMKILGAGAAIGGDFDLKTKLHSGKTSREERAYNIQRRLQAVTGIPFVVEDLWVATAFAERWFGHVAEEDSFVYLQALPFLRSIVFINDRLYRGSTSFAGQIGAALGASRNDVGYALNCDIMDNELFGLAPIRERLARRANTPGLLLGNHVQSQQYIENIMRGMTDFETGLGKELATELGRILVNIITFYDPSQIIVGAFDDERDKRLLEASMPEMRRWLLHRKLEDYEIKPPSITTAKKSTGPFCLFLEQLIGPL